MKHEQERTFCCRFETIDKMYSPVWISCPGLTKEQAEEWAAKHLKENKGKFVAVDDIYETTND